MSATPPQDLGQSKVVRGRGRPRLTTQADVIEAVLAEGLASFTVTAVAERLGTTHATLYGYFESREDLAVAAVDMVVTRTEWPSSSDSWRAVLGDYARTLWKLCQETHGFASCVLGLTLTPSAISDVIQGYAALLETHGFTRTDALVLIDLIGEEVLLTSMLLSREDDRTVEIPPLPSEDADASRPGKELSWASEAGWLARKLAFIFDGADYRLQRASV